MFPFGGGGESKVWGLLCVGEIGHIYHNKIVRQWCCGAGEDELHHR
jgi:hypothetical protein